jgi:hypothetical protein
MKRYFSFEFIVQALQAQACHENMVKVGGYILGENTTKINKKNKIKYVYLTRHSVHG